jgi:hypothetical protein
MVRDEEEHSVIKIQIKVSQVKIDTSKSSLPCKGLLLCLFNLDVKEQGM